MLKPVEMRKVIIAGPHKVQENVINKLHTLGVLHIKEHVKDKLADIGKPFEKAEHMSEALTKIRALIH